MAEREPDRLSSILENIRNSDSLDAIILITSPFININSLNEHAMDEIRTAAVAKIIELEGWSGEEANNQLNKRIAELYKLRKN